MGDRWDPGLYQQSHSFVWEYGRDLLGLLAPRAGERILDAGCGTGQLTAEIARSGATVVGVDRSAAMIAEARQNYPEIEFRVEDITALAEMAAFDAVFSNAALHWVKEADAAAAAISRALRPGGRLVAELGGRGNVAGILEAADRASDELGLERVPHPWYYPSIGEYSALLERHGIEVRYAVLFDRPTPLEGGLAGWIRMFGSHLTTPLDESRREAFPAAVERHAAPSLYRDGTWTADYRRLRIHAVRS